MNTFKFAEALSVSSTVAHTNLWLAMAKLLIAKGLVEREELVDIVKAAEIPTLQFLEARGNAQEKVTQAIFSSALQGLELPPSSQPQ